MLRPLPLVLFLLMALASPVYPPSVSGQTSNSLHDTDAELKERILQEFPHWTNMSDWEKVTALRHWAAVRIDSSSTGLSLTSNASFSFFAQPVSAIFQAFEDNLGGVACGGAAWTLMKLYQLFGYVSHYLGSGIVSYTTHAETLVYIDDQGNIVQSVQDAFFDIGYADQDGRPLDYSVMLSFLRSHGDKEIQVVPPPDVGITRGLLVTVSEEPLWHKTSPPSWINVSDTFIPVGSDRVLFTANFSAASYEKYSPSAQRFLDFLAIQGYPRSLIYIHLYPFQIDHIHFELPPAPVLLSPPDNAMDVSLTPTLSWNAVSGSCVKYSVLIFSLPKGSLTDSAALDDSSFLESLHDRAVLIDSSSIETLVDSAVLPCSVTNYTIPSGKLVSSKTYRWLVNANNTVGWGHASYHLFTTAGPTYELTISAGAGGTTNPPPNIYSMHAGDSVSISYSITGSGYAFGGWVVTGESCSSGALSNPCTFTMPSNAVVVQANFNPPSKPEAPVLASPEAGATDVSLTPTLSWNAVSGSCVKYSVLIYSLSPSSLVDKAAPSCSVTSYTVPSGKLVSGTKYRWYVSAYNVAGWGPRSYRDFTTAGSSVSPPSSSPTLSMLNAAVENALPETVPAIAFMSRSRIPESQIIVVTGKTPLFRYGPS